MTPRGLQPYDEAYKEQSRVQAPQPLHPFASG